MSTRRKWFYGLTALLVVLLALLAWHWRSLHARAALGAAYGARIACSCRYVEGRPLQACQTDKEPGMGIVSLTDRPEARAVSASVPLIATRTARYRPGWGCLLDRP
ncbi:hypothetical protein [Sphingobium cloacae]|uniref:Uncharacterized protein n=1 Tax=Sphingobium cloacae TaxID=120107 RepID=A0A1E1F695_9SPHN|nr:hypothetical protein [Sphingobium cloacae]BAV66029.1 hypothetical protein SCLO_1029890 [Sphingobium cloacae]